MTDADALANELVAFLPVVTAETLSRVLTHDDVETLRDLVRASVSENTIRAVASDLGYLEAWSRAATGEALQWPPNEADGLKFIAHHLFRAEERKARREADKDGYGMPRDVEYQLRQQGVLRGTLPHAPATVSRIRDAREDLKLYRLGGYPVLRGTAVLLNRHNAYLWTAGYSPRLDTYMGPETPNPVQVKILRGECELKTVLADVLALTKINFNSCLMNDRLPVTIRFANAVGEVLVSAPQEAEPKLPFKYYI